MNRNYIKFLRKSRNQHSVHSPFVFCLLTKGLYPKSRQWGYRRKKDVFLYRLMDYFQPMSVFVAKESEYKYKHELQSREVYNDNLVLKGKTIDMILLDSEHLTTNNNLTKVIEMMHNDSILVIDRRIKTPVAEAMWQEVMQDDRITASIDFFYFGVAFVRMEQLKQHFILRM